MQIDIDQMADLCLSIQQIPAPSFAEHARAEFIAAHLRRSGLREVEVDDTPNVYARMPGANAGSGMMVSAHLDTVFPEGTDLTGRIEEKKLYGPGIGDNSMGLAGLLTLANKLANDENPPSYDVWFVANAAEEGLGDLKGMKRTMERLGSEVKGCIILEGVFSKPWPITHRGLGVRRYKINTKARGGHSWNAFGEPSAIHMLVRLASLITHWKVPESPRTTFNIGVIEGGTSINTIAENASMLLDLRSEDADELAKLIIRTEDLVTAAKEIGNGQVKATVVSDRPTGEIPSDHSLVVTASEILQDFDVQANDIQPDIGSTDANIPLSLGLPAVTIYLTQGYNVHRVNEWLSLDHLPTGMALAWRLIRWATDNL